VRLRTFEYVWGLWGAFGDVYVLWGRLCTFLEGAFEDVSSTFGDFGVRLGMFKILHKSTGYMYSPGAQVCIHTYTHRHAYKLYAAHKHI
jgi:hypothetical protein